MRIKTANEIGMATAVVAVLYIKWRPGFLISRQRGFVWSLFLMLWQFAFNITAHKLHITQQQTLLISRSDTGNWSPWTWQMAHLRSLSKFSHSLPIAPHVFSMRWICEILACEFWSTSGGKKNIFPVDCNWLVFFQPPTRYCCVLISAWRCLDLSVKEWWMRK